MALHTSILNVRHPMFSSPRHNLKPKTVVYAVIIAGEAKLLQQRLKKERKTCSVDNEVTMIVFSVFCRTYVRRRRPSSSSSETVAYWILGAKIGFVSY